jgi:hypothetical protein
MQPPMTMARIREAEERTGVKVIGFDTSIDTEDPAVLEPVVAEFLLKDYCRRGNPVTADGEIVAVVHYYACACAFAASY